MELMTRIQHTILIRRWHASVVCCSQEKEKEEENKFAKSSIKDWTSANDGKDLPDFLLHQKEICWTQFELFMQFL